MKLLGGNHLLSALVVFLMVSALADSAGAAPKDRKPWLNDRLQTKDEFVVLGRNDLGMHCINPGYKELALLPPFNNLWVQVIKRGDLTPRRL